MKEKIFGIVIFIGVMLFVGVNTVIIDSQMAEICAEIEQIQADSDSAAARAEEIYADFQSKEKYLSLTVSHEDLTNIEDCFVELIGLLRVGDTDNARVVKDRLVHSVEHLRRLSTFTIDAII